MSVVTEVDPARPDATDTDTTDTTDSARIRRTLEGVIGVPATEGNRVDVLRNGDEIFPAMLEAIDQAEHTIDFLTFVYWEGEIGERVRRRLCERARGRRAGPRAARRLGRAHHGRAGARRASRTPASTSAGSGRSGGSGPARSTTAPTARC